MPEADYSEEEMDAIYQRSLQQAALIGLLSGERREQLALQFVESEMADDVLNAASAIQHATTLILNVHEMQALIDEPALGKEFDRSEQLRPLFKQFYRAVVTALSSGKDEADIVIEIQETYDFPESMLSHFVSVVEASMSPDIEREI